MTQRAAIDTIRGYFYQFDYTITKLLESNNDNDTIVVEGVEDVDIRTATDETAVQCKYYAKTEYNHSVIAKPIRLMLNHYKDAKNGLKQKINYVLYGYYEKGQEKLILPINITFLKENFLTYTKDKIKYYHHQSLGLTDDNLREFLSCLTININAVDYQTQLANIIRLLEKQFECSTFEAENFYYNNALNMIKNISVNGDISEREISKSEFLEKINIRAVLFNEWFILYKGKKKLLLELRSKYFSNLNNSPFERFFLVEIESCNYIRSELKELLFIISKKWSNLSKRADNPFCPYVYIHNICDQELIEVKKEFWTENFITIDGFDFDGALFNPKSISKVANHSNQIKIKIVNQVDYLHLIFNEIQKTKEVYQFFITNPFLELNYPNIKHIKIQIEKLSDIKEII